MVDPNISRKVLPVLHAWPSRVFAKISQASSDQAPISASYDRAEPRFAFAEYLLKVALRPERKP